MLHFGQAEVATLMIWIIRQIQHCSSLTCLIWMHPPISQSPGDLINMIIKTEGKNILFPAFIPFINLRFLEDSQNPSD